MNLVLGAKPLRPVALLLIAMLAVVGSAGCGDDESSGADAEITVETSSITKPQFIKRADAICDRVSDTLLISLITYIRQNRSDGEPEEEVAADAVRETTLPKFEKEIKEIQALGAPAGDEAQIEEYLGAVQEAIESLEAKRRVSIAVDIDGAFRRSEALARAYGLQACV
jgi:hypothetical protein